MWEELELKSKDWLRLEGKNVKALGKQEKTSICKDSDDEFAETHLRWPKDYKMKEYVEQMKIRLIR